MMGRGASPAPWKSSFLLFLLYLFEHQAAGQSNLDACYSLRSEVLRRQVAELKSPTTDPYLAETKDPRHKTYLRLQGQTAIAAVGLGVQSGNTADYLHPMSPNTDFVHWVAFIWVEDQNGNIIAGRKLAVTEPVPATLIFFVPNGTTQMTAYTHCNVHGTFRGQSLSVLPAQWTPVANATCQIPTCRAAPKNATATCVALVTEWNRYYQKAFAPKTAPQDGSTSAMHNPVITVFPNGTASVVVGPEYRDANGNVLYHPQLNGTPSTIHYIQGIWVRDQNGKLIAAKELEVSEGGPPSMTFPIAAGTTGMTAYCLCNIHGVWVGATVQVTGQTSTNTDPYCQVYSCPQVMPRFTKTVECNAVKADAYRQQISLNSRAPSTYQVPFAPGATDELHNPYIIINGLQGQVVIGRGAFTGVPSDPIHPMIDDPSNFGAKMHFIQQIWVEDQNGNIIGLRSLSPSEKAPATLFFDIPQSYTPAGVVTSVRAYAVCNVHGLFGSSNYTVNASNARLGARSACSFQRCLEGASVSACQAYTAEFQRRMGSATAQSDPYGIHLPYLSINGTTGTVVVGAGAVPGNTSGVIHPMNWSSNPQYVHYVSHIFVKDELQNLVTMCEMRPMDTPPATCTFQIPAGINFMKPYIFCPVHGFFVGPQVTVQPNNMDKNATRTCVARQCNEAQPSLGSKPITSTAVEATLNQQAESTARLSVLQMCNYAVAVFIVNASKVDAAFKTLVDKLVAPGDASSDTQRRLSTYEIVIPALMALGGRWYAHPMVMDHLGLNASGPPYLRTDLIYDDDTRFTFSIIGKGGLAYVDGIEQGIPIKGEDAMVIAGSFTMDWGYQYTKTLGPHYTVFYTPNFKTQTVEVMMCAKTVGWLGMGWITPDHVGHVMNHTDMAVAWVDDKSGQAHVEDRFAFTTEEPAKDDALPAQRQVADGTWQSGRNDLTLNNGALGVPGLQWCSDSACNPGFTLVQYSRPFRTADAWDAKLPLSGPQVQLIFAFCPIDPTDHEMIQHDMSTTGYAGLTWNKECPAGTYFHQDRVMCVSCDPGTFRPLSAPVDKCLTCPSGTYQELTGQPTCTSCKPHFTTPGTGATSERACTCSGPVVGQLDGWYHVPDCGDGPTTNPDGSPALCTYYGECKECPGGMICPGGLDLTLASMTNATVLAEVQLYCDRLTSSSTENESITTCDTRDYCAQYNLDEACGHAVPLLKPGYSSREDDPFTVYLCKEGAACPGGNPGTCGPMRDTHAVACSLCLPATYKDSGVCKKCSGNTVWPFIILIGGGCIVLTAFAFMVNQQAFMRAGSATTAGVMVGTMFSAVQTLTTFSSLEIQWVEPLKTILKIASLLSFDLEVIRVSCIFGSKPAQTYGLRLLLLPVSTTFLLIVLILKKLRQRASMKLKVDMCNTVGAIYSMFFIPIVLSFLAPFICYGHPSGYESMISAPSVLCYHDEIHKTMIALGIVAFFVLCVPFCALVAVGTWRYKRDVSRQDTDSLNMFRFLFIRFTPEAYYFGAVVMARSLCICLVPIFTGKDPALQVILLVAVLLVFLCLQLWSKPWRPDPSKLLILDANMIDCVLTSGCILLLICGALCTDFRANQASVQQVGIAVFCIFLIVVVGALAAALHARLVPRPWYKWFLTHHKGGAAAQSRLMKALLCSRGSWEVFIDSDNLTDLDKLFDTVRSRTGMLVCYSTSQVLRRPWCAGEIVIAAKTGVKMLLVETSNFVEPTAEEMDNLADYLDAGRTLLASYGIAMEDVKWSYEYLFSDKVPRIQVSASHGRKKFEELADTIVANRFADVKKPISEREHTNLERDNLRSYLGTVVLTADAADDEANAAAGILALKVQGELIARRNSTDDVQVLMVTVDYANLTDEKFGKVGSEKVVDCLCAVVANARAVLVMLSKGTMRSASQLVVVVEAIMGIDGMASPGVTAAASQPSNQASIKGGKSVTKFGSDTSSQPPTPTAATNPSGQVIIPIQLPGFEFPDEKYYTEVLPHLWLGSGGAEERKAVQTFFKRISTPFSTHASDTILTAQAADILNRIPRSIKAAGSHTTDAKLPSRWQLHI